MNEKREKHQVIVLMTGIIILLLIILFSSVFYIRSSRPMRQARQEATELAKEYANMEEVEDFYWFTREETFFSVVGKDKEQREVIAIIPKSGEKVTILNQSDGLNEEEVNKIVSKEYPEETIKKTTLGMVDNQPVWEVMTKGTHGNNYYLLAFKDGEEIKVIENI